MNRKLVTITVASALLAAVTMVQAQDKDAEIRKNLKEIENQQIDPEIKKDIDNQQKDREQVRKEADVQKRIKEKKEGRNPKKTLPEPVVKDPVDSKISKDSHVPIPKDLIGKNVLPEEKSPVPPLDPRVVPQIKDPIGKEVPPDPFQNNYEAQLGMIMKTVLDFSNQHPELQKSIPMLSEKWQNLNAEAKVTELKVWLTENKIAIDAMGNLKQPVPVIPRDPIVKDPVVNPVPTDPFQNYQNELGTLLTAAKDILSIHPELQNTIPFGTDHWQNAPVIDQIRILKIWLAEHGSIPVPPTTPTDPFVKDPIVKEPYNPPVIEDPFTPEKELGELQRTAMAWVEKYPELGHTVPLSTDAWQGYTVQEKIDALKVWIGNVTTNLPNQPLPRDPVIKDPRVVPPDVDVDDKPVEPLKKQL